MLPVDPRDHLTLVLRPHHLGKVKVALLPCIASVQADRCERSPFYSPAEGWLSLDKALTILPALQEQVIRLRSQEYLSYREIGDRLGCSEADVSIAVDLALRSLGLSIKRPPRQRRRKRSNRRSRQMDVGFRVAAAS
jgi:DNA-directed RNA polymerase specialized sigma24 family protein